MFRKVCRSTAQRRPHRQIHTLHMWANDREEMHSAIIPSCFFKITDHRNPRQVVSFAAEMPCNEQDRAAQPSFLLDGGSISEPSSTLQKDPCAAVPVCRRETTESFPHIRDPVSTPRPQQYTVGAYRKWGFPAKFPYKRPLPLSLVLCP